MKRVLNSILLVVLALGLGAPVAYAKNHAHETKAQKKSDKQWKKQNKHIAKSQKKQLKAQQKQMKRWNKEHHTTRSVT